MLEYQRIVSDRVREIKPSGIRKFFDIVNEMDDVISLGVGEPDFATPWHVRSAGIYSLEKGKTWYTSNAGLPQLREEICTYLERRFGVSYHPEKEVVVTVGGSEAIDMAIRTVVSPGDEVLIPEPCFVCYYPLTQLAGGVPVPLKTKAEDQFRVTARAVKEAITPKTKMLILPYPNNPTGAVMTRQDLADIADVLKGTDIIVLSDEIYGELTYDGKHVSVPSVPGMKERTLLVNGFSKAYAMTGWRLGYVCGPSELIGYMNKVHQFAIMCAPTTSQYAAVEALKNGDEDIERMATEYDMRRRFVLNGLKKAGLECFEPKGAFYVFPSIRVSGLSSEQFCERLLYEKKVALVPGNAFGDNGEGYVRISYSYSVRHLTEALKRIDQFVKSL
ncbi:MAG TPA: aminotransferase class I/II-fold pyridoxal phosphate-dependent enzyme [Clostridia bacterium]|nr:aminotransferase class I/II-fold pyridoxal phosphate-dependent enzyme [Clostridia bacterium]